MQNKKVGILLPPFIDYDNYGLYHCNNLDTNGSSNIANT